MHSRVLTVAVAGLLAACGATPDLQAIAAQQYLAAATPYRAAIGSFAGATKNDNNWAAVALAARALYAATMSYKRAVSAIQFPVTLAADASTLDLALTSVLVTEGYFMSNPSQSNFTIWSAAERVTSSAGNAIRHDLQLPLLPLSTPPPTPLHALDGKQIPGVSPHDWSALQEEIDFPAPAIDMEQTASNDDAYNVAIFDFASSTDAASFYASPPPAIRGFVGGALAYTPLITSTGVASPSRALDMRVCESNGPNVSIMPSGRCSNGGLSYSGGVATIAQRGTVVVFVAYLSDPVQQNVNPADVSRLTQYVQDAFRLLQSVGLQ